ncbi:hypothetical protein SAMN05421837_108259 [Amycolatopsis pretoriensis]|uniref:Uncharacterized protein n=1 Tax=Amycolatopsis pretoriensis TaxID=218821 RepID=A0A1H5RDT0_9PSEU|nr:hypothetical protein SAMN05421837_108259 [Amycolatopsis pretoriensis]
MGIPPQRSHGSRGRSTIPAPADRQRSGQPHAGPAAHAHERATVAEADADAARKAGAAHSRRRSAHGQAPAPARLRTASNREAGAARLAKSGRTPVSATARAPTLGTSARPARLARRKARPLPASATAQAANPSTSTRPVQLARRKARALPASTARGKPQHEHAPDSARMAQSGARRSAPQRRQQTSAQARPMRLAWHKRHTPVRATAQAANLDTSTQPGSRHGSLGPKRAHSQPAPQPRRQTSAPARLSPQGGCPPHRMQRARPRSAQPSRRGSARYFRSARMIATKPTTAAIPSSTGVTRFSTDCPA